MFPWHVCKRYLKKKNVTSTASLIVGEASDVDVVAFWLPSVSAHSVVLMVIPYSSDECFRVLPFLIKL